MAIERALGLREIREAIGNNLLLPQLTSFACVSKVFQQTYMLPAACALERCWAVPNPFARTVASPYLLLTASVCSVLEHFELTSGLHRARAQPVQWFPHYKDWKHAEIEGYPPDMRRLTRRLRPRLYRGIEADHVRVQGAPRTLEDMFDEDEDDELHQRASQLFYDIVTASVEGAPRTVLLLEYSFFRGMDEFDRGEEIWARLSFSVDGGEPRKLCHHHQCSLNGDLLHGSPLGEEEELPEGWASNPRFWHARSDPTMDANIQAFASRFGLNDPLRTCDMKHILDAFLHYAWKLAITEPGVLDCLSWTPIKVPWQSFSRA